LEEFVAEKESIDTTLDIDELIQRFSHLEEENFSLFNYVNELNNQVNSYSEEVTEMDLKSRRASQKAPLIGKHRFQKAAKLEDDISDLQDKAKSYNEEAQQLSSTLEDVIADISKTYEALHLPKLHESVNESIQEREAVILKKLRSIESKTNELLMKNILANLPRKMANAASANPDKDVKEGDGNDPSKDAALVATMISNLRRGSIGDGKSNGKFHSVIGAGPDAPVPTARGDNSILSGYKLWVISLLSNEFLVTRNMTMTLQSLKSVHIAVQN
jgi:hypothetical protein